MQLSRFRSQVLTVHALIFEVITHGTERTPLAGSGAKSDQPLPLSAGFTMNGTWRLDESNFQSYGSRENLALRRVTLGHPLGGTHKKMTERDE